MLNYGYQDLWRDASQQPSCTRLGNGTLPGQLLYHTAFVSLMLRGLGVKSSLSVAPLGCVPGAGV